MSDHEDSIFDNSVTENVSENKEKEHQNSDFEVPETETESESEDSDDENIVRKRKHNPHKIIDDSDSEENEDNIENRALSPRTRFSITGIRPKDISSSSEFDESDEENEFIKSENFIANSSKNTADDSNLENTTSSLQEFSNSEDSNKNLTSTSINETNLSKNRFSSKFNSSISNKLSSTTTGVLYTSLQILEESKSPNRISSSTNGNPVEVLPFKNQKDTSNSTNSDSVEVLEFQNQTIDISSESDISITSQSSTPISSDHQIKNLVQTKLTSLNQTPTTHHTQRPKFVSPSYLDKEIRQLEDLKKELSTCINLTTVHKNLPDGGSKMLNRIEKLKTEIKERANQISNLVVDKNDIKKPVVGFSTTPTWDEIDAATNAIQPKYTGKIGLATFAAQKSLTIDRLKDIHGSLETCPNESLLAEDPKGLTVELMDHQKHALAWMGWREKQKPRGGILADDMGLGKTLTMISLILESKKRNETSQQEESSDDDTNDKSNNNGWTAKGRKVYHDGGTLVVAPASLLKQWESEVANRTKRHLLSICVHHGTNRETKARHLAKYDIVVTTYNIVSREFKTLSTLFNVRWERIILDEAHVIRNNKSQSSIGVCGLKGKYRWALTGTPIQNKESDLYAIIKFLKCSPFDDLQHWKKWIDNKSAGGQQRLNTLIKSLLLRRTKVQLQEKGELLCLPEKDIQLVDVTLDKEEMNVYQKIMIISRTLFAQFLHQRAEKNNDLYYTNDGNRPTFMQVKDPNGAYHKMHQKVVRLHGGSEVKSHEILVLLLRLRQICCHPGLIDAMLDDEDNESVGESSSDNNGTDIDLLEQLEKLQINDQHEKSSSTSIENLDNTGAISRASSKVLRKSNPVFNLNRLSSKMRKIIEVLEEKILNTNDKAIIVSQWTSVLNLLQTHLSLKKIPFCCLNGSVPVKHRNDIVTNFNKETTPEHIMLLSLTAGGVGLNLVGANHLFLIDLHWNPQLELQAQDRIYRVGQKKHVYIYKFMCKDTIEERIRALQEHKLGIANGVLTGSKSAAGSKLTLEDLKSLFGL